MRKLLILILVTTTVSIYAKSDRESLEAVNIAALKGPTGLSLVRLIHDRDDLNHPTNINYKIVNTPQLIVSGLLSQEYDIATLPTNLAAILYNRKSDYVLIAVTGYGSLYLLSSRDDINKWEDLKGKKINNIARSSTPGFLFDHLLKSNNITTEELEIDFKYNHIELAPILIAGKEETGILPEPLVTKVLTLNSDMKIVLDFQEEYMKQHSISYPLSCIVARKSFIMENQDLLNELLASVKESIDWVNKNPFEAGETGEIIGLGVSGSLIVEAIGRLNLEFKTSSESKAELMNYYNILSTSDPESVGGEIPADGFFLE